MITVTAVATNRRLTTVEAVREQFAITQAQADDAVLAVLVERASAAVATYCNRIFARQTYLQTTYLDGMYVQVLLLERFPALLDNTFVLTENNAILVRNTDYVVDEDSWVVYRLSGSCRRQWTYPSITIAYKAGYVLPGTDGRDLPYEIEQACLYEVGKAWSHTQNGTEQLIKSEKVDNVGEVQYYVPGATAVVTSSLLSDVAARLLDPYIRLTF